MRLFRSLFFIGMLLFVGVGCERHPASQTLPEYRENHHSTDESKALIPSTHPPRFFHSEKSEAPVAGATAGE